MGDDVHIMIESLIRKEVTGTKESTMIKICRKQLKIEQYFNILLISNVARPKWGNNITNHISIVNFFVSLEGLHENLLAMIVENERPDLKEEHFEASNLVYNNINSLKENESKLLEELSTRSALEILADDNLLNLL